jgi:hypothetical protein
VTQSTTANQAQPAVSQTAHSSALRLLAGGLVAVAAAFVIQTVVYRLVDDDPFSATLAGIDFAFADGAVLVALVRLAADAELRPFAASAAASTGLLVAGDVVAVAAHFAGPAPEWLRLLDAAQGSADPPVRAGGTLLVLLALWVLAQGYRLRASVAVAWTVPSALVLSMGLSLVGSVAEGGRSVAMAWIGWLLEVARPAALAALALAVLRARERTSLAAGPPPQTAYRQPGGLPASAHAPPPVAAPPLLVGAAAGFGTLRRATLARMLLTAGLVGVLLSVVSRASPPEFPLAAVAFLSAATSLPLLVGLGRVLSLARPARASGRLGWAMALRALGCLFDVTAFVGIAMSGRADPLGQVWLLEAIPIGVVATLLVASAMATIGRRLDAPVVVRDARWVLAIVVVAVGVTSGAILAAQSDRAPDGTLVGCVVVMCAAAFAVQRLQARLAGKAGAAIAADLAHASAG